MASPVRSLMPRQTTTRDASGVLVDWVIFLGLLSVALPLTFFRLGAQSLWLDEGTTQAYVTSRHVGALLLDLFRPAQAYPLYHLVVKVVVRLLGDSEWALRLPSAIASGCAVPMLYLLGKELRGRLPGLTAALLLVLAPWGLKQAQDAKAYGLMLLVAIVLAWTFSRAQRLNTRRAWLVCLGIALIAPFVHRLLIFSLLACITSWAIFQPRSRRWPALLVALVGAVVVLGALIGSLQYHRASGQFAQVGPVTALGRTFTQFSVGQFAGDVPRRWFVPFIVLMLLGLWRCWLDLRPLGAVDRGDVVESRNRRGTVFLLILGGLPLLLFLILLLVQPAYEARYLMGVYPFWLLLLGWGFGSSSHSIAWFRTLLNKVAPALTTPKYLSRMPHLVLGVFVVLALLFEGQALTQPGKGIFSGSPIKEDYRDAVRQLAAHVHPDDLVIVHPKSILPLYTYYARRVSDQILPSPIELSSLFQANIPLRDLDQRIRPLLRSKKRDWLLIAPAHAAVDDPPPTPADDVGWVGLAFTYGDREGRIQCGPPPYAGFVGVRLYCNNLPDINGIIPQPEHKAEAIFGGQLRLRGYTVTPFPDGPQPGGTLPISLFWEPLANLSGTDYIVFLHLTLPDDPRPLSQTDGRPMEGGQPTSRWTLPHALLHDDRTIPLPPDLPPGHYVVRVGVYEAADGLRLPATTKLATHDNAVVLGDVQILPR